MDLNFVKDVSSSLQRASSVLSWLGAEPDNIALGTISMLMLAGVAGRVVYLVFVATLLLCLLGHKMVSPQVSSNGVNVWNLALESGGLRCM